MLTFNRKNKVLVATMGIICLIAGLVGILFSIGATLNFYKVAMLATILVMGFACLVNTGKDGIIVTVVFAIGLLAEIVLAFQSEKTGLEFGKIVRIITLLTVILCSLGAIKSKAVIGIAAGIGTVVALYVLFKSSANLFAKIDELQVVNDRLGGLVNVDSLRKAAVRPV